VTSRGDGTEGPDTSEIAGEFAYAIPAGLVIALHLLLTLAALGGLVQALAVWSRGGFYFQNVLITGGGAISAMASMGLCALLWLRRSWLILLVPLVTLPLAVAAGVIYVSLNWSY
jgi:hypothetical protein